METQTNLYEQDFYLWTQERETTLGAREFEALDIPHLIAYAMTPALTRRAISSVERPNRPRKTASFSAPSGPARR